ncbi:MAG: ABC transporter permease [Thermoleophilia bacterium]
MLKLAWRGVVHNRGRYIATLVAILTGVAFFTATGFISDRVISSLEGDVNKQYGAVDVAVVPVDASGDLGNLSKQARIPRAAADRITALPGVEAGDGVLTGSVGFLGADGKPFAQNATGRLWVDDADLNPLDVSEGRAPEAAGEIAVDEGLARNHDLPVGAKATILTLAGQFPVTVVGHTKFGSSDSIDSSGTVSLSTADAFDWLSSGIPEYQSLYLRGSGSPAQLTAEVAKLAPSGFEAQTGEEFRADQRSKTGGIGRVLKNALQAFAILALLVGAFVIYNTFSVIVAQRMREIAVLAAIGATPKQIRRSLRWEGVVIGLLGSALGVVTGIGLSFLVIAILGWLGVSLPGGGIAVRPQTVILGILIGTVITVASVMIPARRASRTEPIQALRDASVESVSVSRRRVVATMVLLVLGLAAVLLGTSAWTVGVGALLMFVGTIVAGPVIALWGTRLVTPLMSRLGMEGRLAADNTARNPRRTATTANALLIGVFLVTLVTVAGTSAKDFVVGELKKVESADYLVVSDGGTLDEQFVAKLTAIPDVNTVSPFRRESVTIDGEATILSTADVATISDIADVKTSAGSLADLKDGTIAVVDAEGSGIVAGSSDRPTPKIGATVHVVGNDGRSADLKVVAVTKLSIDSSQVGSLVTAPTFDRLVGDTAPTVAFVDVASGAQSETKDAIEAQADLRPDVTVTEGNAIGRLIGSAFDFLINAVNGLLLMSVVVALIGIINTLSLSILERRRELGLLRVVGMTDRRVQRMIRLESVLIAALGTVTGLVLGSIVGWGLIGAISRNTDAGLSTSLPFGQLGLVLLAGIALGLIASLIPARRSTRLEVLDAISST